MYVVLGANGRAGGETAHALIECGEAVRVVVRRPEHGEKWRSLGADVAIADIDDADSIAEALDGALGAFLLNPPPVSGDPYARTVEIGTALAKAVRRGRVPKVVVLSSIGAQHASGTGVITTLHQIERLLDHVAPATAFLRSGYFVETWGEVAGIAISEGVLPTFLEPDQRIPTVSTSDVGRTAAALLREDWTGKRIVELSGPEDWSAGDVASAFADALGCPVFPAFVPPQQRAAILAGDAIPYEVATALLGMYEGIAENRFAHEGGGLAQQRCEFRPQPRHIDRLVDEGVLEAEPRRGQREALAGTPEGNPVRLVLALSEEDGDAGRAVALRDAAVFREISSQRRSSGTSGIRRHRGPWQERRRSVRTGVSFSPASNAISCRMPRR